MSNHFPNVSFPWSHFKKSLAAFWFFEYLKWADGELKKIYES